MLTKLQIQHYKSLSDVLIDFQPTTILVGPNGSGKSNVIDALKFIRDAVVHTLDHAVSARGGIDVLRQYSPRRPYIISLKVNFEYESEYAEEDILTASYSIRLASTKGDFYIESEEAIWEEDEMYITDDGGEIFEKNEYILKRDADGNVDINYELNPFHDAEKIKLSPDILALTSASVFWATNRKLQRLIGDMSFAHIFPNILRNPSRPDTDRRLKEDCSNWASVIKNMRSRKAGENAFQTIMQFMKKIMPNLEHVKVTGVGGYLVPQFLVNEQNSRRHYFDPIQLSDGTLRVFGILLALYQVPRPEFFAMEEPEQTVHPGVLALLVDAFREVSSQTQILLTTHSPQLLDYFNPEEIRVVVMEHGETRVKGIKQSQIETVRKQLMSISEIMTLDGLLPEA